MVRFIRWVWSWYEVLALWQWITGPIVWGVVWAVLALTIDWPLWYQALVAAEAASVWLSLLSWLTRLFRQHR